MLVIEAVISRAPSLLLMLVASACHDSAPARSTETGGTGSLTVSGGGVGAAGVGAGGIAAGVGAGGIAAGVGAGGIAVGVGAGGVAAGAVSGNPGSGAGMTSYSTDFNLTESPISERGVWKHAGLDWAVIGTASGLAYGTQTGTESGNARYSDSYAYLEGFPANVSVSTVLHKETIAAPSHETAILLRWSDAVHVARGYECGIAFNGAYGGVTRWNGGLGDFTSPQAWQFGGVTVKDGDVLSAQIVGNVITMRLNGTLLVTADIATAGGTVWTDGNPGFSCFRNGASGSKTDFSITSFSAMAL